jgi:mono/diheme cytochrome c family protein
MNSMGKAALWLGAAGLLTPLAALSDAPDTFAPEQIKRGAATFAEYCTPCHGERMSNPELFNLRAFPKDQRARFINSVTNGKNAMPPWRGQLKPDDIDALWSYVATGEKSP